MIGVGTLTALQGVVRGVSPGGMDPRRFLAMPLFALVVFGLLLFASLRSRRDPRRTSGWSCWRPSLSFPRPSRGG